MTAWAPGTRARSAANWARIPLGPVLAPAACVTACGATTFAASRFAERLSGAEKVPVRRRWMRQAFRCSVAVSWRLAVVPPSAIEAPVGVEVVAEMA